MVLVTFPSQREAASQSIYEEKSGSRLDTSLVKLGVDPALFFFQFVG